MPKLTKQLIAAALICVVMLFVTEPAWAESDRVLYMPLNPDFVTNVGLAESGRMKYLKAKVTVRVNEPDDVYTLQHHMPVLRHTLVSLFSRQDEHILGTPEGREALRRDALKALQSVLEQEEGQSVIEDLLFDRLIVQH